MVTDMSAAYRVHLQGFSPFERSALGSYFRLAARRSPAYDLVNLASEAHFIVADADHPGAVAQVADQGRVGDTVFVGAQAPGGALAWLMRPIDPLHVLRELDALVALRGAAVPPVGETPTSSQRTVQLPPRPGRAPARRADDGPRAPSAPPPAPPARHGGNALLVDGSEPALRLLAAKLHRFGLQCECTFNGEHALALLARRAFDFVFTDLDLDADSRLDGYALCQEVRRLQRQQPARKAPVLAIVSAHAGEVDRVRGALAGADGYLGKPVADEPLERLMALHGWGGQPLAALH